MNLLCESDVAFLQCALTLTVDVFVLLFRFRFEDVALHLIRRDRVGRRLRGRELELVVDERVHVLVWTLRLLRMRRRLLVQTLQPRLRNLRRFYNNTDARKVTFAINRIFKINCRFSGRDTFVWLLQCL